MTRRSLKIIGLMTSHSFSGVDAVLVQTNGEHIFSEECRVRVSYPVRLYQQLIKAVGSRAPLPELENAVTKAHIKAVKLLLRKARLRPTQIDAIGMHGQTIVHKPNEPYTRQLGNAEQLSECVGITVISNFREKDMLSGGQGYPLLPIYIQSIAEDLPKPFAVINLGGVANVVYVGENHELIAFDTGPGTYLLNKYVRQKRWNIKGLLGTLNNRGKAHAASVNQYLENSFFHTQPPKAFDLSTLTLESIKGLSRADGIATLMDFTCQSIALSLQHFPSIPKHWMVMGRGRTNPALMKRLHNTLYEKTGLKLNLKTAEQYGFNGQTLESQMIAFMAARRLYNLPVTFPNTTGTVIPTVCGDIYEVNRSSPTINALLRHQNQSTPKRVQVLMQKNAPQIAGKNVLADGPTTRKQTHP